ncbi:hypothetical protein DIPPA_11518 [Diplonema papillatum]|nr:hypothetical protein DIPPA_11518 [Diplonema papillatum]
MFRRKPATEQQPAASRRSRAFEASAADGHVTLTVGWLLLFFAGVAGLLLAREALFEPRDDRARHPSVAAAARSVLGGAASLQLVADSPLGWLAVAETRLPAGQTVHLVDFLGPHCITPHTASSNPVLAPALAALSEGLLSGDRDLLDTLAVVLEIAATVKRSNPRASGALQALLVATAAKPASVLRFPAETAEACLPRELQDLRLHHANRARMLYYLHADLPREVRTSGGKLPVLTPEDFAAAYDAFVAQQLPEEVCPKCVAAGLSFMRGAAGREPTVRLLRVDASAASLEPLHDLPKRAVLLLPAAAGLLSNPGWRRRVLRRPRRCAAGGRRPMPGGGYLAPRPVPARLPRGRPSLHDLPKRAMLLLPAAGGGGDAVRVLRGALPDVGRMASIPLPPPPGCSPAAPGEGGPAFFADRVSGAPSASVARCLAEANLPLGQYLQDSLAAGPRCATDPKAALFYAQRNVRSAVAKLPVPREAAESS